MYVKKADSSPAGVAGLITPHHGDRKRGVREGSYKRGGGSCFSAPFFSYIFLSAVGTDLDKNRVRMSV